MNPATNGGTMETHEALAEARKFLDDYSADDFGTHEAFVAAAILWGERVGAARMREVALQAAAEARDEILDSLAKASTVPSVEARRLDAVDRSLWLHE